MSRLFVAILVTFAIIAHPVQAIALSTCECCTQGTDRPGVVSIEHDESAPPSCCSRATPAKETGHHADQTAAPAQAAVDEPRTCPPQPGSETPAESHDPANGCDCPMPCCNNGIHVPPAFVGGGAVIIAHASVHSFATSGEQGPADSHTRRMKRPPKATHSV